MYTHIVMIVKNMQLKNCMYYLMNTKRNQKWPRLGSRYTEFIWSVLEPQHYIKSIPASTVKQTEFSFFLHKAKLEKMLSSQGEIWDEKSITITDLHAGNLFMIWLYKKIKFQNYTLNTYKFFTEPKSTIVLYTNSITGHYPWTKEV